MIISHNPIKGDYHANQPHPIPRLANLPVPAFQRQETYHQRPGAFLFIGREAALGNTPLRTTTEWNPRIVRELHTQIVCRIKERPTGRVRKCIIDLLLSVTCLENILPL